MYRKLHLVVPYRKTYPLHLEQRGTIIRRAFAAACVFLILLAVPPASDSSQKAVTLAGSESARELSGFLSILKDPDHRYGIEEVSRPALATSFVSAAPGVPHLGLSEDAVWVKFRLASAPPDGWLLHVGWPFLASVKLRDLRLHPGTAVTGNSRGGHKFTAWGFPGPSGPGWTIYSRFVGQGILILPMKLYPDSAHLAHHRLRSTAFGLYYGVILAMAFYNLFLFFSLRDRTYIYYVLYTLSLFFYFLSFNGLTLEFLLPGRRALDSRITLFFLAMIFVTAALFTRKFLDTRRNAPLIDRMMQGFLLLGAVMGILSFTANFRLLTIAFSIIGLTAPFLLIFAGILIWRQGFRPARFYLLAWTIYSMGVFLFALTYSGDLPFSAFGLHSYQIASAIEAILLSFALADRIRLLRMEREAARHNERRAMELALTDELTGLYNPRFFRAQIGPEIQRAENLGQPLSLIMLDVDDFKQYNDTFGHIQGDRVLTRLGDIIKRQVRTTDHACRYGGEEFAIIMPACTGLQAMEASERIRRAFGSQIFTPARGVDLRSTVSMGVSEYASGLSSQELVDRADQALYQAKKWGKDRVCLWGDELPDTEPSLPAAAAPA